jgi:CRP/FNR family transcriptional regulator, cyclic AMP receptor protein
MLRRVSGAPVALVKQIPLFSGLDDREIKTIAESMKERTFSAGNVVFEEGQSGVGFFVIESGSARVSVGGRELGTLGAGDHFGEIALIGDFNRTATVSADSELRCYGMTAWQFRPLVEANASIAWKLLQIMAQRLVAAEQQASEI